MNKFLVVSSALVAAVYGEADAQVIGGLGLPYAYGVHAFGGKSAPCVNGANIPVPCAGAPLAYAGYPYAAGLYGKRDAEAEPEADAEAAVLYGGYGYPYGYSGLGYAGLGHAGLGYAGLGHAGLGYAGLGYGGVHATNAALGHAVAATPFGLTHSSNVGICTNYLGASVPCGRKKREAEAEPEADAEAALLYGGYGYPYGLGAGYAGLGYSGLGYAGLGHAGLGYAGLGYAGLGYAGLGYAGLGYGGVHATNAALGHAVAYTPYGATHSANVGVCTNYLGAQVPC
eukprot:GFUD01029296.1.p1 GENE.GFUD01029296.1~~GFUD01029296.1.p1  ORF type:complete len:285 (-),score=61.14 GFUD01029296.1:124-978(-)